MTNFEFKLEKRVRFRLKRFPCGFLNGTLRQMLEREKIVFFNCLDVYNTSPDSGALEYKSGN